jgi:Ca2+/Na+ antiporter
MICLIVIGNAGHSKKSRWAPLSRAILGVFLVAIGIALAEFVTVFRARIQSKTKSNSRVVVRGGIVFLLAVLFWVYSDWKMYIIAFDLSRLNEARVHDVPFLFCVLGIGLVGLTVIFELLDHYRAFRRGLTTNKSRLISGLLVLLCLVPILKDTLDMWDVYVMKLAEGSKASSGAGPKTLLPGGPVQP